MDSYLPIQEAEQRIRLPEHHLRQLVAVGKIRSVMIHGVTYLREMDVMSQREAFKHLEGVPIGIGEASRKYGVSQPTLSNWKKRGYLRVIRQDGQKIFVDESDVAYSVARYMENPGMGKWTRRKAE